MAVALTYAPGLQLGSILPFGILAALLAMGLTAWQVERLGVETFEGYPLRLQTLGLPVTLALLVLVIHRFWPGLSILAVIALVAPLLALLFMPQAGRGLLSSARWLSASRPSVASLCCFWGRPAGGWHQQRAVSTGLWQWPRPAAVQPLRLAGSLPDPAADLPGGHSGRASSHQHLGVAPLLWPLAPDPSLLGMCFLMGWGWRPGRARSPAPIWRWRPATT